MSPAPQRPAAAWTRRLVSCPREGLARLLASLFPTCMPRVPSGIVSMAEGGSATGLQHRVLQLIYKDIKHICSLSFYK
eukprot:768214-Hanusia_phi.AAC.1